MKVSKLTLKQLWDKACIYDRIPTESKFVTFSEHNPWIIKYNEAITKYFKGK